MKVLKVFGKPFVALAGKVDHTLAQKMAMSAARHVANSIGTLLVGYGVISSSQVADVVGAVTVLLAVGAGALQKRLEAQ